MLKLITINENNVAWVETECGKTFGIVDAYKIIDEDGLVIDGKSTMDVLDCYVDINQDWETEANLIDFKPEVGENFTLKIDVYGIDIINMGYMG